MGEEAQSHAPLVTVLAERTLPADRSEGACKVELPAALTQPQATDAHFMQGHAPHGRRFVKGEPATMTAIALDFDAPDHAMTPAWAAETQAKIEALLAAHRGGFGYMTKNGARVVWAIEPVAISDAESACNWSRRYLSFVAYLRRCWQLEADALHDHTRLFRLPFVVRDGVAQRPLTIGDPRAIGALDWAPTAEDEAAAAEAWPRIFDGTSTPPLCGTDQPPASRPQRIEG